MSKIYDAQDRIATLLTADEYFADVPVISQRKGNLAAEIQAKLNTIGLGVLVLLPKINFEGQAERILLGLVFAVVVSENPTINQTGKTAEAVMEKIMQLIHWQPNGAAANPHARHAKYQLDQPAAEMVEPTRAQPALLNYLIRFKTSLTLP